jgi:hypothetical protein
VFAGVGAPGPRGGASSAHPVLIKSGFAQFLSVLSHFLTASRSSPRIKFEGMLRLKMLSPFGIW